jgi:hypothetical protein
MSGDSGSIASRWPTGKVQQVALRATPRVDPSELVGRIAVAEVLAPDPVGSLLFAHHNSSWQLGFEHERELQAVAAARFVEQLVGERDASHVVLGGTGTPPPTRPACAAGAGYSLWAARACATGTLGRASTPGPRAHVLGAQPAGDRWQLAAGARTTHRLHHGALQRTWPYPRRLLLRAHLRRAHRRHWASDHFGGVADLAVRTPGPMVPS